MLWVKVQDDEKYCWDKKKIPILFSELGNTNHGGEVQYRKKIGIITEKQKGKDKVLRIVSNLIDLRAVNRNHNEIAEWCFHFSF